MSNPQIIVLCLGVLCVRNQNLQQILQWHLMLGPGGCKVGRYMHAIHI